MSAATQVLLATAIESRAAPWQVLAAVNVAVPDGLLIPDLVVADLEAAADADAVLNACDVAVAVEIASAATRVTDRTLKPALYAAAGIPHYWRLELVSAPRLYLGHLERGNYVDRQVRPGQTTAVTEPIPLDIDPAQLVKR